MIMRFIKKVPAGMMIVPMLIASLINTFIPQIVQIGSFTTAVFTSAGAATAIGIQLFCLGTTLQFKEMPKVFKRGGILLLSKFAIGAAIGIGIGKMFGMAGVLGLTTLSVISAVTNSNGSVYLSLMNEYGDETDAAAMALLALNDGPFLTLIALGASGLANIPFIALVAAVVPIVVGMILGNIDQELKNFLAPAGTILIPFVGFALGAGINITNIVKGGPQGILLGLICTFLGGIFIVFCDRFIGGRPGYAAWAVSTTAGNAVAVPAAVALIDPAWQAYVGTATTQVAAATVVTALLVPFITDWWAKKYGCPKYPLKGQEFKSQKLAEQKA
ncbi:2-keto-3-deoxygluconate permease [Geosporobacter ferrireducens]|uniref:2-keto-3-deoxygluconate permease n=1 Tax=Geosporobacter ferrireducens TaxID=1424294 RepID=A0A1D8GEE6_9FIRM|nr:2-keto-3-deoxygluconate permease [Geosporobacter ferrireducens]AOT69282.1 2-keto-3-deoxygluconate permease [Geosporobacter ferrireducens]MTI56965.1 2-keto-3-deoxygluconate permease [Geosporobacter ferrireducens]